MRGESTDPIDSRLLQPAKTMALILTNNQPLCPLYLRVSPALLLWEDGIRLAPSVLMMRLSRGSSGCSPFA